MIKYMEEKNNKGIILLIFILIMFSSKLWGVTFNIFRSFIYLILIIYFVNLIDPNIAKTIKEFIHNFYDIQSENNFIRIFLSKISSGILNVAKPNNNIEKLPDDLRHVENKNLEVFDYTNNKSIFL